REMLQRTRNESDQRETGFVTSGLRVVVSLENVMDEPPAWTGLEVREQEPGVRFVPFDLGFRFVESAEDILVECTYNTELFEPVSARRWLARLERLIEAAAANPDQRISDLPTVPESERLQVLREWNATDVPFPLDQDYTGLFEAQAAAHPNVPAVHYQNKEWTYAELNDRANRVAHFLRHLDIGPEKLVGICMDRSLEMAAALLGVLKSGAAYLPLDPAYPQERLDYMIADSGTPVLLTQRHLFSRLSPHPVRL